MGKPTPIPSAELREGILKEIKSVTNGTKQTPADSVKAEPLQLKDFWVYAPENKYLHKRTNKFWPEASLKKHFNNKAPQLVSQARSLQTKTWRPGSPQIMKNVIVNEAGLEYSDGLNAYNAYREPNISKGDPGDVAPWLELLERTFPDHSDHLIAWFAQRVQHPGVKINHAIVLGGKQGIGKDTLLAPVIGAIGAWNFNEASPQKLLKANFNGFVKSVILRVSEARDMGDKGKYALYEELKKYTAAPPEYLPCNEKHKQEFLVKNVCGVVITTNHKTNGIYLPADDRRHYVAWSEADKTDFKAEYWDSIWGWYQNGGDANVAAYLAEYDLSDFNPKAPPPKTDAFYEFVDAGRSKEDSEMAACLKDLEEPVVVTIEHIKEVASASFFDWLSERNNAKKIPAKLEKCGYEKLVNPAAKDTRWSTSNGRKFVYGNLDFSKRERLKMVQKL